MLRHTQTLWLLLYDLSLYLCVYIAQRTTCTAIEIMMCARTRNPIVTVVQTVQLLGATKWSGWHKILLRVVVCYECSDCLHTTQLYMMMNAMYERMVINDISETCGSCIISHKTSYTCLSINRQIVRYTVTRRDTHTHRHVLNHIKSTLLRSLLCSFVSFRSFWLGAQPHIHIRLANYLSMSLQLPRFLLCE